MIVMTAKRADEISARPSAELGSDVQSSAARVSHQRAGGNLGRLDFQPWICECGSATHTSLIFASKCELLFPSFECLYCPPS